MLPQWSLPIYLRPIRCLNDAIVNVVVTAYCPSGMSASGPSLPIKHGDANGSYNNTADVGMPTHEGQKLAEDRHPHSIYRGPFHNSVSGVEDLRVCFGEITADGYH
jgi:hypothetical protein